ncbi:MAG: hypothetical protein L0H59_01260 [Tomitella sp.]|nr:hypothetical protein [Tomitella sp.]
MVCRENKARSFCIGLVKRMQRHSGGPAFHDAEIQSSQHEHKHAYEAMTHAFASDPKKWETMQRDYWMALRQKIADSPDYSEQDKYRKSEGRGGQPGLITRLDQELDRLRTGKDESGKLLRPEQLNKPEDMMAITRAGSVLERIGPAKENFLEMNARHRGVPMRQARTEWNELMNRKGDFSNISLTDDYRDSLSAAGVTARDQADLGQSGRARDAMRVMEQRRTEAVGKLEHRPTIRPEHKRREYVDPHSEAATIRCSACGQFGHEDAACPNGDIVAKRKSVDEAKTALGRGVEARKHRALVDRNDEELQQLMDQSVPGQFASVAAFRSHHEERIDEILDGKQELSGEQIRLGQRSIAREERSLTKELASRGGTPSWVKEVHYNPENGLLVVRPQDKATKDGVYKKARPFARRVSPETMEQLLDHPKGIGVAVNEMGLIRGNEVTNYVFENPDDMAAATRQHRCPSCGQWASLDTSHRCVIKDGPSEEYKVRDLAAKSAYADALLAAEGAAPDTPSKSPSLRSTFPTDSRPIAIAANAEGTEALHGRIVTARPTAVVDTVNKGDVAAPAIRASYPDAEVTGTFAVWEDLDAQRVMSPHPLAGSKGMRCTCEVYAENGNCRHVRGTFNTMRKGYGAVYARQSVPGGTSLASNTAADAPLGTQRRLSYAQIQQMRSNDAEAFNDLFETRGTTGADLAAPAAVPPRTADGTPTDEPHRWDRNPNMTERPGKPVDLSDSKQVAGRVRRLLAGRPPRVYFSVRREPNDGITVNIPPKARGTGEESYYKAELGRLLGTEAVRGKQGYYIPPTAASRFAALDKAAGDPGRIRPAEWVTSIDPERAAANRRRRNEARGQNAGADDAVIGQRAAV